MTTDSRLRVGVPQHIERRSILSGLRAPGLFLRWPLLGLTMFLLGALTFSVVAYGVSANGPLRAWDASATQAWNAGFQRVPPSLVEYVIFGFFVGREMILILAAILGIYFLYKRYWRELAMVLWGPGVGGLLWFLLSDLIARPRPATQIDVLTMSTPSFPSGHAITAVLGYGLLGYLLVPNLSSRFWKWFVSLLLIFLTAFVGMSRLLLGSHYVSDVVAGYAVGIAWAGLIYTFAERFFLKRAGGQETSRAATAVQGLRTPGWFAKRPTLGLVLFLFGSLSFAALGYSLVTNGALTRLDVSVYEQLIATAKASPPVVDEVMIFAFFLGKQVILLIVTLLSIYFVYQRYWCELAMILLSSAGGSFVWNFVNAYFARPRPTDQTGLAVTTIPAFPSGHAMSAIICYGFLTYLLVPRMPSAFWKWLLVMTTTVIILFGGFSRIFQGGHYLTDVIGGYALGLAWAALVYTVTEIIFLRKKV